MLPSDSFRVLSLDGGGMRGLYTASLLENYSREIAKRKNSVGSLDIGAGFDLIVGTSTGGIIAAALAAGKPISLINDLYRNHGKNIFSDPFTESGWKGWAWRNRKTSSGNASSLRSALVEIFQEMTFEELYQDRGVKLCLPAINMATNSPRVFKTPHGNYLLDAKLPIVDACLATSAAPIVLPLASVTWPEDKMSQTAFVDGGLFANNPSLIGLIEALEFAGNKPIQILSLGTCPPPNGQNLQEAELNRGLKQWKVGLDVLDVGMDAQSKAINFAVEKLCKHLGEKCTIIRPKSDAPLSARDAKNVGLDQASDDSIRILSERGRHDAQHFLGNADRSTSPEYILMKEIFDAMPVGG